MKIKLLLCFLLLTNLSFTEMQEEEKEKASLIYIGDPMCCWCYGIAPDLSTAIDSLGESVSVELVMGGLRPYNKETMADLKGFLTEHREEVAEMSGQPFNYEVLDQLHWRYDTEPPSRAVLVVRQLKPEVEFDYFKAIQKAFYVDGKNTNDDITYIELASEFGISPVTFSKLYDSPEMKQLVRKDFEYANSLGVRSFPSIVLKKGDAHYVISNGYASADKMVKMVNHYLEL